MTFVLPPCGTGSPARSLKLSLRAQPETPGSSLDEFREDLVLNTEPMTLKISTVLRRRSDEEEKDWTEAEEEKEEENPIALHKELGYPLQSKTWSLASRTSSRSGAPPSSVSFPSCR